MTNNLQCTTWGRKVKNLAESNLDKHVSENYCATDFSTKDKMEKYKM